jgi:hypothetical protein
MVIINLRHFLVKVNFEWKTLNKDVAIKLGKTITVIEDVNPDWKDFTGIFEIRSKKNDYKKSVK